MLSDLKEAIRFLRRRLMRRKADTIIRTTATERLTAVAIMPLCDRSWFPPLCAGLLSLVGMISSDVLIDEPIDEGFALLEVRGVTVALKLGLQRRIASATTSID